MSWSGLGLACAMLGDLETGKRHAEKGLEIHRESEAEMLLPLAQYNLSYINFYLGDLRNARNLVEEALRLSQKHN